MRPRLSVLTTEFIVQFVLKKKSAFGLAAALGVAAVLLAIPAPAAHAQGAGAETATGAEPATGAQPGKRSRSTAASRTSRKQTAQRPREQYYVDFRARTAASYGHAFVWYGKTSQRAVEVAGLHPRGDSTVTYVMGHILPVPSDTGASYGDLDEEYVTAKYRVFMNAEEAQRVFAYIKHLQNRSPFWNAAVYNCVAFIRDIALYMGLKTPVSHLMYPEDWVNKLQELNGARPTVRVVSDQGPQRTSETFGN